MSFCQEFLLLRSPRWESGVKWLPNEKTNVFVFTLDKTSGDFSPTTRYQDCAISSSLIHWESQSRTTVASEMGQRYLGHVEQGTTVVLFARLRADERASGAWVLPRMSVMRANVRSRLPGGCIIPFPPIFTRPSRPPWREAEPARIIVLTSVIR